MHTGKFTLAGSRWALVLDWRQGGQHEAIVLAQIREDEGCRRNDVGMTEEDGLEKPHLSTL